MIELHKEGKEIKEIHKILNNANIKISYGSTWNIVEASRSQSEPSNQVDQSRLNSTISERDHSLISSSVVDSKSGPSGCPLSRFIPQEEIPEIKDSELEDSKDSLIPQEKKANDQPTITNDL